MKFHMGFGGRGLGKEQGGSLSRQWKWLFLPLPCHILRGKTRLCLQEAEVRARLTVETVPQPLEVILDLNLDKD